VLSHLQAVVIGLTQGVTDLVPISSLGHSVLIPALIGGSWKDLATQSSTGGQRPLVLPGVHRGSARGHRRRAAELLPVGVEAEKSYRAHAIVEQIIADLKNGPLAHLPYGSYAAITAWLVCAAIAFNLTRAAGVPRPARPFRPSARAAPAPGLAVGDRVEVDGQNCPTQTTRRDLTHPPRPAQDPDVLTRVLGSRATSMIDRLFWGVGGWLTAPVLRSLLCGQQR